MVFSCFLNKYIRWRDMRSFSLWRGRWWWEVVFILGNILFSQREFFIKKRNDCGFWWCYSGGSKRSLLCVFYCELITNDAHFALLCPGWLSWNILRKYSISYSIWVNYLTAAFQTSCRPWSCYNLVLRTLKYGMWKLSAEFTRRRNLSSNADRYVGGSWRIQLVALYGRLSELFKYFW